MQSVVQKQSKDMQVCDMWHVWQPLLLTKIDVGAQVEVEIVLDTSNTQEKATKECDYKLPAATDKHRKMITKMITKPRQQAKTGPGLLGNIPGLHRADAQTTSVQAAGCITSCTTQVMQHCHLCSKTVQMPTPPQTTFECKGVAQGARM
jgi:hypothetical protein